MPTPTTTTAPMTLCHRNEMSGRPNATDATAIIPAINPTNAPVPVARRVRIASMNTPRIDP